MAMDEFDLYEALTSGEKTAAFKDSVKATMKQVKDWVKGSGGRVSEGAKKFYKKNEDTLIGGTAGYAAGVGGTYLAHRKNKKTGKTPSQKLTDAAARKAGPKSKKDKKNYTKGIAKVMARAAKDIDEISAEHPKKAALTQGALAIPLGAATYRFMKR